METILNFLKPLIEMYAGNYGVAVQIVTIVGSLRVAIKPLMSAIKSFTEFTYWTTKDDEFYSKVIDSKIYMSIVFVLDWIASIKLPVKTKK